MEHEQYGKEASWIVVDKAGKPVADNVCQGFDQTVQKSIREYLRPSQLILETKKADKPPLENWQKYMDNREVSAQWAAASLFNKAH